MYGLLISLKDSCLLQVEVGEVQSKCTVYKDNIELHSCMITTQATLKLVDETPDENIQVYSLNESQAGFL